jgi:hypothetical protein
MNAMTQPKHVVMPATKEEESGPGVMTVLGIVAGGAFGLAAGLAQYSALFSGAPQFLLPAAMTIAGGMIGAAVFGGLGWLGDRLLRWGRARRRPETPQTVNPRLGPAYPRHT